VAATSITRLRIRKWRYLPAFLYRAYLAQRQAAASDGFLGGYVATSRRLAFWTVTVWRDAAAMHAYRRAGMHLRAMPHLFRWADESSMTMLDDAGHEPPSPEDAARLLGEHGRMTKVRFPSEDQRLGRPWPDGAVPRPTQNIRPLRR